jgi:D-glycero-D-manno-heptose 1,7-bisphosphate phosphatase
MTWTVFLDRDGTLNVKAAEGDYVKGPDEFEMLPGAARAVAALSRAGLRLVLVTNQRGIARGLMTAADVDAVHDALVRELAAAGARLDAIYVCPHEDGECDCRKPGIGLFLRAREADPGIDFAHSVMVGDSASDVQAGRAAGMPTVGLGPGAVGADHVAADLEAAVPWILERAGVSTVSDRR